MLAKFEKRAYVGSEKVWVGKYRNLQNISHWHMEHEMIVCMEGCAQVMVATQFTLFSPRVSFFAKVGVCITSIPILIVCCWYAYLMRNSVNR